MSRILPHILYVFIFLSITLSGAAQNPSIYRPGVIHVKVKKESYQQLSVSPNGRRSGISEVDAVFESVNVTSVKRIFREAGKFEKAHRAFDLHLWYEIEFSETLPASRVVQQLKNIHHFELVEPARAYRLIEPLSEKPEPVQHVLTDPPNDPRFPEQWHYRNTGQTGGTPGADIRLIQAWALETGNPSVVVAVIDGGIDYLHPDITQSMWINADEIPNNGIDDDQNGYVDDIYGYGFGDNTGTIFPNFHGTHVGGTIAAVTNNAIGVSGIAGGSGSGNGVRLMSLAGFGNFGVGGFEAAMVYAADNGAVISQNSWGGGGSAIEAAINYFIARAGFDNSSANFSNNIQIGPMAGGIVIFAAGNDSSDSPAFGYPASYPPVMAVASTDHNDQKSWFSNYGSWVDIAAPGSSVLSTYPTSLGSYALLSGTSMACPHVSGVAALIISKFGGSGFVPNMVWQRLQVSSDNIDSQNPDYVNKLGSGRLNAHHALEANDDIPPGTITDLTVIEPKLTSILLSWTAPGSSGMEGSASGYDLRYSLAPITEANFTTATQYFLPDRPKPAGATEEFLIAGLMHSTTYYFAVKARDFSGNSSDISNVITGTTLLPPVMEVSPASLTENLFSGETSTRMLRVTNAGASALELSVKHRVFTQTGFTAAKKSRFNLSAAPEELLTSIISSDDPYRKPGGKLPVGNKTVYNTGTPHQQKPLSGGRLFTVNSALHTIDELNPATGSVINSIPAPEFVSGGPDGLAFDGQYLYFINSFGTNRLYRINPQNGAVISSINLSGLGSFDALGHSGNFLYVLDYGSARIFEIDFDEQTVERIIVPGFPMIGGLTFGGSRGTMFVTNSPNMIYELDAESGALVNSFSLGFYVYGLGYSDELGILFSADVSNGILRAHNPDTGALLYTLSTGYTSALASDEAGGGKWLGIVNFTATLLPGESTTIPVLFDARELLGGTYQGGITISSNDPVNPMMEVPVTLHVTGAPNISVNPPSIDFGNAYEGSQKSRILVVKNTGTDALMVNSMITDNPAFAVVFNPIEINPRDSAVFIATFHAGALGDYSGTLTIGSNDPNEGTVSVILTARVVLSPIIGLSPDSIGVTLLTGQQTSQHVTISNTGAGNLNWNVSIEGQATSEIGSILSRLNTSHASLTSLIPNRYNFSEGETGYFISDGGNDMYDGGNILSTNLSGWGDYIQYSNKVIQSNTMFGPGGKYFTAKYQGLFVLVADVAISSFFITGNAGADGAGNVDGAVLNTSIGGKSFKGFVKRIYNAWDPSINHLIIVENKGASMHSFPLNTDDDAHTVNGLGNIQRLYYLLYAGANGFYIDNNATLAIMNKFLELAGEGNSWATLSPNSGETSSGNSGQVVVTFNATGIIGGVHQAKMVIQSNDPVDEVIKLPLAMRVIGVPDISLSQSSIDFGTVYLGEGAAQELTIINSGTDVLSVSSIASSNPKFIIPNSPFQIVPGGQQTLLVQFSSSQAGTHTGTISISSNDPDQPVVTLPVTGQVITSALLEMSPNLINITVVPQQRKTVNVLLKNIGGEALWWNLWYTNGPIDLNQYSGSINPGGQQIVQLSVDAWGLSAGSYQFALYLYYNQPIQPTVQLTINVTVVPNRPPQIISVIPAQYLDDDQREVSINLATHISDPDGDPVRFSVSDSINGVVTSKIVGSVLTLKAKQMGSTSIQVIAEDPYAARVQTAFNVVVGTITDVDTGVFGEIRCYPNPFDQQTAVYFSLTRQSHVHLVVLDVMGRTVQPLVNHYLETGDHVVPFDGSRHPSGLYYFKLVINGKLTMTAKLVKK
jgi:subtilisin family serine protease